jgi:LDH2 family malate/lactate/ureidoglycolate dehydrogenase
MNVSAEHVKKQITLILTAWGMDADLIGTTAQIMIETDLSGIDSHGISMLMDYEQSRLKGRLNLHAHPQIVRENAVTALIDACAGLGHPGAVMGMDLAIKKALENGVGVVTVFNSHHFGAAGRYAVRATQRGLIGMVTSASRTINTVPTRSAIPVLGTNPIAFAAPARRNRPFLLDMATATVASNKVKVYELNNKALPPGWVLDEHGHPVTEAATAMDYLFKRDVGGLAPLGGTADMASYKGYGLAMLAHILGGTLSGASFSPIRLKTQRAQDPDNLGHFFMALDPKMFRPEGAFEEDLDAALDVLHAAPPVDSALPVLVAGDPEAAKWEQRLREGIPVPDKLVAKLREVCERCGAPFVLQEFSKAS